MARKKSATNASETIERVISFRAPDSVHGALKMIVGRLEMTQCKIDDHVPYERDVLTWLLCDLYMDDQEKWPERLRKAHASYIEFQKKIRSQAK